MNAMIRGTVAALLLAVSAQAEAQNSVTITPAVQLVAGTNQITITIKWCGYPPPSTNYMDIGSRSIQANWVDVTGSNIVLPLRPVLGVALDPRVPAVDVPVGYAAVGGFNPSAN